MTAAFSFTDDEYRGHTAALENQLNMLRSRDVDSRTLYGTTARGWTLWSGDRRAAQRRLVQDLWQQLSATVPREAKAMLVAGVDGAGKTTMRSDRSNGFTADRYFVIDPDEIDSGVFEAVAGAFEGQHLGVVDDAVDHRGRHDLVTEDVAPAGEGQVGGQDQRGVFVAAGDARCGAAWPARRADVRRGGRY